MLLLTVAVAKKMRMAVDRLQQPDGLPAPDSFLSYVDGTARFSVIVDQLCPATLVVYVAGEIDLLAESSLRDHLTDLFANWPEFLIIDLSQVSFMGAAGISVLVNARDTAARQGAPLNSAVRADM